MNVPCFTIHPPSSEDLLPEGRSFDSLGRPSEVAVAFQQLVQQYQTQLWSASANGELATVRRLLQQFQDPNGRDEQGESLGSCCAGCVQRGVVRGLGMFGVVLLVVR